MQITENIKNCNGCGACVVGCRHNCIKMTEQEDGKLRPYIDERGCRKCNACRMYCPLFMPVTMPEFSEWYEMDDTYMQRDMPAVYRETMRSVRSGQYTEFVGTLCQIAGLKALMADKFRPNLKVYPLVCTAESQKQYGCRDCEFYK